MVAQTRRRRTFLATKRNDEVVDQDKLVFEPDKKTDGLSRIQSLYLAGGVLDTASIVVGTIGKASAIRAQGKFEEAGFVENAKRLKLAAEDVQKRGDKDAARFMRRVRGLIGAQRASVGASGIEIDTGTAAAIQAETLEIGSEDASTIRINAVREAFGLKQQAIEQESAARLSRISRKSRERTAKRTGTLRATQTILSTSANINRAGSA